MVDGWIFLASRQETRLRESELLLVLVEASSEELPDDAAGTRLGISVYFSPKMSAALVAYCFPNELGTL